jgi:chorismate mutase
MADTSVVRMGGATFGADGLTLIADLGRAETPEAAVAAAIAGATVLTGRRLDALTAAGAETGLPVIAWVTDPGEVGHVAERADILRVEVYDLPLLDRVGRAGRPVMLERGPHAAVRDWLSAAERLAAAGVPGVVLCERGGTTRTPGVVLDERDGATRTPGAVPYERGGAMHAPGAVPYERDGATRAPGVGSYERGGAGCGQDRRVAWGGGVADGDGLGHRTGPDIGMVPSVRRRAGLPVVVDPGADLMLPLSLAAIGAGADGLIVEADTSPADLRALTDTASRLAQRRDARCGVPPAALDLAELRDRLNLLDEQIIRLIADRRDIAAVVGQVKARDRRPVRDLRRETQVLEQATALAERLCIPPGTVTTIFGQLIADAVALQSAAHDPAIQERARPSSPPDS